MSNYINNDRKMKANLFMQILRNKVPEIFDHDLSDVNSVGVFIETWGGVNPIDFLDLQILVKKVNSLPFLETLFLINTSIPPFCFRGMTILLLNHLAWLQWTGFCTKLIFSDKVRDLLLNFNFTELFDSWNDEAAVDMLLVPFKKLLGWEDKEE